MVLELEIREGIGRRFLQVRSYFSGYLDVSILKSSLMAATRHCCRVVAGLIKVMPLYDCRENRR